MRTLSKVFCAVYLSLSVYASASDSQHAAPISGTGQNPASTQMEQRRALHLRREIDHPFPSITCSRSSADDPCVLGMLNLAIAQLFTGNDSKSVDLGNRLLRDALVRLRAAGWEREFHFMRAGILFRAVRLFGSHGVKSLRLLNGLVEREIIDTFAEWARSECTLNDGSRRDTWVFWGSENHGAQRDSACWEAASLLRLEPDFAQFRYGDGSSAEEQVVAWTDYLKRYIRDRSHSGVLIEYFSPTYTQYTLAPFYNYADFASDPRLREMSRAFLDLWWCIWAHEQIGGKHGGSKARSYPRVIGGGEMLESLAQLYFGLGSASGVSPGEVLAFTSQYRPPPVVSSIALDVVGRGTYDLESRAPGIARRPVSGDMWYSLDPSATGMVRVTRVSTGYVMGLAMMSKLSATAWVAPSSQNRLAGIVLAGPSDARISIQPKISGPRNNYNSIWGVQHGSAQLIQRLKAPYGQDVGPMQIWFGRSVPVVQGGSWVFVDGSAYVAIRPAWGQMSWDPTDHQVLRISDDDAPIIVQVAPKSDFSDLNAFKTAVVELDLKISADAVIFRGLADAGTLKLFHKSARFPEINDKPIELNPNFSFRSPFINAPLGSSVITIRKGEEGEQLDFR